VQPRGISACRWGIGRVLPLRSTAAFPVLTADRQWNGLDLGIDIHLIR